jgi:hypothetical protein
MWDYSQCRSDVKAGCRQPLCHTGAGSICVPLSTRYNPRSLPNSLCSKGMAVWKSSLLWRSLHALISDSCHTLGSDRTASRRLRDRDTHANGCAHPGGGTANADAVPHFHGLSHSYAISHGHRPADEHAGSAHADGHRDGHAHADAHASARHPQAGGCSASRAGRFGCCGAPPALINRSRPTCAQPIPALLLDGIGKRHFASSGLRSIPTLSGSMVTGRSGW